MATIQENKVTPEWVDDLYQIEMTDPVMGGADGVANRQAKQLGARTQWLKKKYENQEDEFNEYKKSVESATELKAGITKLTSNIVKHKDDGGYAVTPKAIVDYLASQSVSVKDVNELRNYESNGLYVNVSGYYASTPGIGGGLFVAAPNDKTSVDNGGTIIVASNGMRWHRLHFGVLSLRDFGYDSNRNNEVAAFNAADTAGLNVVMDCLGLTIDVGNNYPHGNKYTNGKFNINGKIVDVQYQTPRTGIGRFITGSGAAANLKSNEWTGAGLIAIGEGAMGQMEKCVSAIAIGDRAQGFSKVSRDNIAIGADSLINVQAETEWYDQSKMAGTRNIGIGGNAGRGITSGFSNVAIGRNAGQGLSTGISNIALGAAAMAGTAPVGLTGDIEVFGHPQPQKQSQSANPYCNTIKAVQLKLPLAGVLREIQKWPKKLPQSARRQWRTWKETAPQMAEMLSGRERNQAPTPNLEKTSRLHFQTFTVHKRLIGWAYALHQAQRKPYKTTSYRLRSYR